MALKDIPASYGTGLVAEVVHRAAFFVLLNQFSTKTSLKKLVDYQSGDSTHSVLHGYMYIVENFDGKAVAIDARAK